jgi:hypothetical protein
LPAITKNRFFCSLTSSTTGEQLFGTASRGDVWFLLEYRPHWEAEAFAASSLPALVKERITGYLKTIPASRLHFIKHQRPTDPYLNLFVVLTREIGPVIYKFPLSRYEDFLGLDFLGLLQRPGKFEGFVYQEPLFLVCTHGKHDKCCAKFGRPVAKGLDEQAGLDSWQASHLGGDRFAANLVCFPHGIYYGRVQPDEVETIVNNYRKGEIYLEKLRGRSCYNFITQVGEYYLRRETTILDLPGFHSLGGKKVAEEQWVLQFQNLNSEKIHTVTIQRQPGAIRNFLTCNALKESSAAQYRFISHQVS